MQGHVRQVTDIDGDAIAEYQYDAWGLIQLTAAPAMAFGDWGYAWDGKPGRYYVQQRHLRADLGRWMSVDPVESEPPYAYVGNRPTWAVDPSGMQANWIDPNTQKLIGIRPATRVGPLDQPPPGGLPAAPHHPSGGSAPRQRIFADWLGTWLLGCHRIDAMVEQARNWSEVWVRVAADELAGAYGAFQASIPGLGRAAGLVPVPTPLGWFRKDEWERFRSGLGPAANLVPPHPADPANVNWAAGFAWGVVDTLLEVGHQGQRAAWGANLADLIGLVEQLREVPDLWHELGKALAHWWPKTKVRMGIASRPEDPFTGGKTAAKAIVEIVQWLDTILRALRVARFLARAIREGGGLLRMLRDPLGFAEGVKRGSGKPGPLTAEEKANIKAGLDELERKPATRPPAKPPLSPSDLARKEMLQRVRAHILSPDPKIRTPARVARRYQKRLVRFEHKVRGVSGEITDVDVELDTWNIEVTTGKAQHKAGQLLIDMRDPLVNPSAKALVLYAPNSAVPWGRIRYLQDHGVPVARTLEELDRLVGRP